MKSKKDSIYDNNIYELEITINPTITSSLNALLQKSLLEELCEIIKPYLKDHDLITVTPNMAISILLIDYTNNLSLQIKKTLDYNLDKMLRDNNWADEKAISSNIQNQSL